MTINQSKIGHFHPDFDNFYPDFYPYRPGRNKRPGSHLTAHPPTLGKSSFYPPRAFARETTVYDATNGQHTFCVFKRCMPQMLLSKLFLRQKLMPHMLLPLILTPPVLLSLMLFTLPM